MKIMEFPQDIQGIISDISKRVQIIEAEFVINDHYSTEQFRKIQEYLKISFLTSETLDSNSKVIQIEQESIKLSQNQLITCCQFLRDQNEQLQNRIGQMESTFQSFVKSHESQRDSNILLQNKIELDIKTELDHIRDQLNTTITPLKTDIENFK